MGYSWDSTLSIEARWRLFALTGTTIIVRRDFFTEYLFLFMFLYITLYLFCHSYDIFVKELFLWSASTVIPHSCGFYSFVLLQSVTSRMFCVKPLLEHRLIMNGTFRNKLPWPICPGGGVIFPHFLELHGRLWPKPDTSVRHINIRRIWKHNAIFCYKNHKLCKSETCRSQFISDCNNPTMYINLNHQTRPVSQIIWYVCVSVTPFSFTYTQ